MGLAQRLRPALSSLSPGLLSCVKETEPPNSEGENGCTQVKIHYCLRRLNPSTFDGSAGTQISDFWRTSCSALISDPSAFRRWRTTAHVFGSEQTPFLFHVTKTSSEKMNRPSSVSQDTLTQLILMSCASSKCLNPSLLCPETTHFVRRPGLRFA